MQKPIDSVVLFLLVMWLVYLVDWVIPADFNQWGLMPRTLRGLIGIPLSPFLHGGLWHLIGNTLPLAVLMFLTLFSRHRALPIIIAVILIAGSLLWLVGRPANHVGASGLVFGLCAFLITVGIRERKLRSLAIALGVAFFFGGTLLWGILPSLGGHVSWEGHLCGLLAGIVVGTFTTPKNTAFS